MKESIYTTTGRGYPFFFQHGLGSDRVQPQALLSGLEGIQLISMDSRGHGSSPFTGIDDISFDRYADDVIDLATHLNINQAYVGGISMGAGIALNIALRYPHFAKALVLVRPAWLDQEFPENLKLMAGMADFMKKNEPESFQRTPEFLAWQRKEPLTTASLLAHTKSNLPDYAAELIHKMWSDRPIKHLTDLQKKYQTNGFQMLGISVDENPKEILPAFIEKMGINYPVALSSPSVIDGFGGVEYLPTAFLINQEGKIVKKFVGYVEPQVIQAEIEKLL